jgi:DNA polymerase
LAGAAEALLGGEDRSKDLPKGTGKKDMSGHKVMMKLCKPRATLKADLEPIAEREGVAWKDIQNAKSIFALRDKYPQHSDLTEAMNPWHEKEAELDILFKYCAQDVRVERAISDALPSGLSTKELKVWQMDQEMNHRGVQIDMPLVDAAIAVAAQCKEQADLWISEKTDGVVTSIGQRAKFLNWLSEQPCEGSLDNLQKATVADAVSKPDLWTADALRALQLRQSVSKTSTKKYDTMAKAVCTDSRVRGLLAYHGADTGRWAGRIVQPQNFPRGTIKASIESLCGDVLTMGREDMEMIYGDPMEVLSSALRGAITSSEGTDLICADYSAIEARGLFWIAGDERALSVFRQGRDIYKDMAVKVYGVEYDDVTAEQRQMGKQAILGLGYQMGAAKFQETCLGYGMEVSLELAQKVVDAYRGTHAPVKAFWYAAQAACFEALERGRGGAPVALASGRIQVYHSKEDFLHIRLPSGRKLSFYKPRLKDLYNPRFERNEVKITFMGVNSMTRKYSRLDTYGGKLVENIVQALSRDIMVEAMLELEYQSDKYTPILTVHDEIVAEVPEGVGSVEEFELLIAKVPGWAKGFPLDAEGWRGKRYRK